GLDIDFDVIGTSITIAEEYVKLLREVTNYETERLKMQNPERAQSYAHMISIILARVNQLDDSMRHLKQFHTKYAPLRFEKQCLELTHELMLVLEQDDDLISAARIHIKFSREPHLADITREAIEAEDIDVYNEKYVMPIYVNYKGQAEWRIIEFVNSIVNSSDIYLRVNNILFHQDHIIDEKLKQLTTLIDECQAYNFQVSPK
ncbi:MAG: hypothetical protein M3R00_04565, partial [Pseudomonadota bacterium]|nr:hypothetical protein [Pseudomonadota bacterium]